MSDVFATPTADEIAAAKAPAVDPIFAPPKPNEIAAAKQTPYTPVESAGMGGLSGLTMGFAPAIGGASATASQNIENLLSGKYDPRPIMDQYRANRDYITNQMNTSHQQNPKSFVTGEIGGTLATAAIPGLGELGITKGMAPAAQAVARGAVQGGLTGLGNSEADLTKGEVGQAAYDTAKGSLTGGVVGGIANAVAAPITNKLSQVAEQRAFKAATGQKLKALRDAVKTGKVDVGENGDMTSTMGRHLLEADEAGAPVVGPLSTAPQIASAANQKAGHFGAKIGEVANQIDEAMPGSVSGENIAKKIEDYMTEIPQNPANNAVRNKLQQEADFYKAQGNISFADAQKLKNSYNFKPTDSTTQVLGQDATNAIRRSVGQEMDETADLMSKASASNASPKAQRLSDLLDKYQQYKQKYGSYASAAKAAEDQSLRQLSNRYVSPSDYGMGSTGAILGSVTGHDPIMSGAMGLGAMGANKVLRERGSSLAASGANSLAEALQGNPQAFGPYAAPLLQSLQKGNSNLALTHYLLMRNDPRYRQLINNQGQ